jgi:hypothetical protein
LIILIFLYLNSQKYSLTQGTNCDCQVIRKIYPYSQATSRVFGRVLLKDGIPARTS